jgi:hypothetical protein
MHVKCNLLVVMLVRKDLWGFLPFLTDLIIFLNDPFPIIGSS